MENLVKPTQTKKNQKKVLVVEDERAMANALVLKLTSSGIFAKAVFDGQQALNVLKKEKFDFVLLDLIMPRIDGFGVLEELQIMKNTTPVIVLSNLSQAEDGAKAVKLGAKDYFVKSDTSIVNIINYVKKVLKIA